MIDKKIKELRKITTEWLFIEYYSHTDKYMYKIQNEFTPYQSDIKVLCEVDAGIELALDYAITELTKTKKNYFNQI